MHHWVCHRPSPAALLLQLPIALLQGRCQSAHVQARPPMLCLGLQHLRAPQLSTEIQPLQALSYTSLMLCLTDCRNRSSAGGQQPWRGMAVIGGCLSVRWRRDKGGFIVMGHARKSVQICTLRAWAGTWLDS